MFSSRLKEKVIDFWLVALTSENSYLFLICFLAISFIFDSIEIAENYNKECDVQKVLTHILQVFPLKFLIASSCLVMDFIHKQSYIK